MIKSIRSQIQIIVEKKFAVIIFVVILLLVIYNFLSNVFKYKGTLTPLMINPMRLLFISGDSLDPGTISFYFMQLFPLLVTIPAGYIYADEHNSKEEIYISSKLNYKKYIFGKLIASFIVTAIVFSLPLIIEIILNSISFPLSANGNLSNNGVYQPVYVESAQNYLLLDLFVVSPYVYAVITSLIFGCVAGILGTFTVAISFFIPKYKILLLLPVYILLYGVGMLNSVLPNVQVRTSHFAYLSMFDITYKNETMYFFLFLIILVIISACGIIKARKDLI